MCMKYVTCLRTRHEGSLLQNRNTLLIKIIKDLNTIQYLVELFNSSPNISTMMIYTKASNRRWLLRGSETCILVTNRQTAGVGPTGLLWKVAQIAPTADKYHSHAFYSFIFLVMPPALLSSRNKIKIAMVL